MARARKYVSHGGKTFIDDLDKLDEYLKKTAKGFITNVSKDAAKRLKYNTAELIYNAYQPKQYKRTMELLDSIYGPGINGGPPTENIGSGFRTKVGFNTDLIKTRILPKNPLDNWPTHMGFNGDKTNDYILNVIIFGFETKGIHTVIRRKIGGKKIVTYEYDRDPVHMIQKTITEIYQNMNRLWDKKITATTAWLNKNADFGYTIIK